MYPDPVENVDQPAVPQEPTPFVEETSPDVEAVPDDEAENDQ